VWQQKTVDPSNGHPRGKRRRQGWLRARRRQLGWALAATLVSACSLPPDATDGGAPGGGETHDLSYFLRRLRQLDHLPRLERWHTAMASTWDRSGGNDDDVDFKGLKGDTNVLLDVDGPGCVHRLFTGLRGKQLDGTRLQIYLDRQPTPLADMPANEFFNEAVGPFPYPLLSVGTYPGTHFPIPFSRHIRIQLASSAAEKNWGVYWQITYSTYPAGTDVRSLSWPLSAAERDELEQTTGAWAVGMRLPARAPDRWSHQQSFALGPGDKRVLPLAGCGVIRQLRLGVSPRTAKNLTGLRLRMRWDGAGQASVDVPLGYFFGHGDSAAPPRARYSSLVSGVTDSEAYTRLPMPFASGAEIELHNRTDGTLDRVQLKLDLQPCATLPADVGRLHATWRQRQAALAGSPRFGPKKIPGHVILERSGRGKYVGALLHLQWPYFPHWWGEGDVMIWSDESAWPPSYHGTGTEEYFHGGYTFFDRKAISGFVTTRPGPVAVYSFHLNDGFAFDSSIRVAVETVGSWGGQKVIDQKHPRYGSTAFWYALPAQAAGSDQ
jgi:hypothetical protein